jgi:hypothetical protein
MKNENGRHRKFDLCFERFEVTRNSVNFHRRITVFGRAPYIAEQRCGRFKFCLTSRVIGGTYCKSEAFRGLKESAFLALKKLSRYLDFVHLPMSNFISSGSKSPRAFDHGGHFCLRFPYLSFEFRPLKEEKCLGRSFYHLNSAARTDHGTIGPDRWKRLTFANTEKKRKQAGERRFNPFPFGYETAYREIGDIWALVAYLRRWRWVPRLWLWRRWRWRHIPLQFTLSFATSPASQWEPL